jgi:hypothetical protein
MVTQTTPSRAKRLPSYQAVAAVPYSNALPGIQTSTGCPGESSPGDQMLRLKQSSPGAASSGMIAATGGG